MSGKIVILILIPFAFAFSCNAQGMKSGAKQSNAADTILYAEAGVVVPNLGRALGRYVSTLADPKGLTFHSTRAGKSIWIDSVCYDHVGSKRLFMIARMLEAIFAISYKGDSLKKTLIELNVSTSLRAIVKMVEDTTM